jgi:hypothetical protein
VTAAPKATMNFENGMACSLARQSTCTIDAFGGEL